jgi:hypothetical protein
LGKVCSLYTVRQIRGFNPSLFQSKSFHLLFVFVFSTEVITNFRSKDTSTKGQTARMKHIYVHHMGRGGYPYLKEKLVIHFWSFICLFSFLFFFIEYLTCPVFTVNYTCNLLLIILLIFRNNHTTDRIYKIKQISLKGITRQSFKRI